MRNILKIAALTVSLSLGTALSAEAQSSSDMNTPVVQTNAAMQPNVPYGGRAPTLAETGDFRGGDNYTGADLAIAEQAGSLPQQRALAATETGGSTTGQVAVMPAQPGTGTPTP
ncbi:MAG: hypothetical protein P4M00_22810 [Azospirillaceae bacterium]|nr:hypothetical protein [Azospirillaceae bacterium]